MTTRGLSLLLVGAAMTAVANLLFRVGIRASQASLDTVAHFRDGLVRLISQPAFDVGLVLYGVAALVWFRIVSTEPLSAAYPLLISVTFMLVTVGAVALFGESMTQRKLSALAITVVGILVLGSG
jgi:multidrug transporter EmrE-like cation transporter